MVRGGDKAPGLVSARGDACVRAYVRARPGACVRARAALCGDKILAQIGVHPLGK